MNRWNNFIFKRVLKLKEAIILNHSCFFLNYSTNRILNFWCIIRIEGFNEVHSDIQKHLSIKEFLLTSKFQTLWLWVILQFFNESIALASEFIFEITVLQILNVDQVFFIINRSDHCDTLTCWKVAIDCFSNCVLFQSIFADSHHRFEATFHVVFWVVIEVFGDV